MDYIGFPEITTQVRYTREEQEAFFDTAARTQIALDFDYVCFFCKNPVELHEAHFVPIIEGFSAFISCMSDLYTHALNPYDAANGVYSCRPCAYRFMSEDDSSREVVLMPCVPLMRYVMDEVLRASDSDEALRLRTLDMILDDLEHSSAPTPEQRRVAPFLHCFQLYPYLTPDSELYTGLTKLPVYSSPSTYLDDVQGSDTTHYSVIEHDGKPGFVHVPLFDQGKDDPVVLWRIPGRSHGKFFGNADAAWVPPRADRQIFEVFDNLRFALSEERGLPKDYVPGADAHRLWNEFTKKIFGSADTPPASKQ